MNKNAEYVQLYRQMRAKIGPGEWVVGHQFPSLAALMPKTRDLAQKVTHGDTDAINAFAAAQATVLLVRTTGLILVPAEEVRTP